MATTDSINGKVDLGEFHRSDHLENAGEKVAEHGAAAAILQQEQHQAAEARQIGAIVDRAAMAIAAHKS